MRKQLKKNNPRVDPGEKRAKFFERIYRSNGENTRMTTLLRAVCLIVGIACPVLTGCASGASQSSATDASEGRILFGSENSARSDDGGPAAGRGQGWGIVLRTFPGEPSGEEIAEYRLAATRAVRRSDVRSVRLKSGVAVVLGTYTEPDSARAKQDLEMVRGVIVGGRRPYARAFMVPPVQIVDFGSYPQYNLASVRSSYGRTAIWTFQIGVYESPSRDEAKRAAEEAVVLLRRDGEQAFYYHGQTRSMVTVGVFGRDDYDEQGGIKNPAIHELIKRYPLNLLNGQYPIVERRRGQEPREQRSLLVRIPE